MSSAWVSKITHASSEDGPGLRTVVFLSGCNLHCQWCHNPECILLGSRLMFFPGKCIGCNACITTCRNHKLEKGSRVFDSLHCLRCGRCVEACLGEALQLSAREMDAEQVFIQIARDKAYYRETGGVTVSGGECLLYPQFLLQLLTKCKQDGIKTCIESALNVDFSVIAPLLGLIDYMIADIKLMDSAQHLQYTGADNRQILQNIRKIAAVHDNLLIRIPLIPGVTDTPDNLEATADYVAGLAYKGTKQIELLRYNPLADSKYHAIGKPYRCFGSPQTNTQIQQLLQQLSSRHPDIRFLYSPIS